MPLCVSKGPITAWTSRARSTMDDFIKKAETNDSMSCTCNGWTTTLFRAFLHHGGMTAYSGGVKCIMYLDCPDTLNMYLASFGAHHGFAVHLSAYGEYASLADRTASWGRSLLKASSRCRYDIRGSHCTLLSLSPGISSPSSHPVGLEHSRKPTLRHLSLEPPQLPSVAPYRKAPPLPHPNAVYLATAHNSATLHPRRCQRRCTVLPR